MRELTRNEWTAFHATYLRSSTAVCPECHRPGEAVLRPLDHTVRFGCGHELAVPDNTEPLPQTAPAPH
ncbi:hypothetical protein [Streptomyces antibioticus]|uniref:hypothetical protein n=1 Tax=Streptomyces antibioticus TaxID=1890 RepID=UPI00341128D2